MHSIFTGRYKYINYPGQNKELLFDLIADPEESVNLIEEKPSVLQTHRMMAREFLWNLTPHAASRGKFTEELSEQLKALGYIQ